MGGELPKKDLTSPQLHYDKLPHCLVGLSPALSLARIKIREETLL
jgi:hypothetical protein